MEEKLFSLLTDVLREDYPGSIVTHYTTVATVITEDGTELVVTLDRPDQAIWQSMGMLDFVREMRRAIIANQVCEHDEDPD
jgi:hypothetical protein